MSNYINFLNEVSAKRFDVEFTSADINSPFVKRMIDQIVLSTDMTFASVVDQINSSVEEAMKNLEGPDALYLVARQNVIESVLFSMIDKLETTDEMKFDPVMFNKLFNYILVRNKSFLKIKDPITKKRLKLSIIYTPQPDFIKQPEWVKNVSTAAASPEGDLIFNTKFVEQLSKYAMIKSVKPKGSIYESNGGSIPDHYAYLEFLIMHEIYHIVHADHFYQSKKEGMTGTQQNWLGDFITNYNLVKAGYEQLPIGLFSRDYNYDKYDTMNAMQDAIIKDMTEVSKDQQKQNETQMDDHMDKNHEQTNKGDPQDGQGDPQDGQGDPQDGQGDPQDGQGDPQDGDGAVEKAMKDADKKMAQSADETGDIDKEVEKMKDESAEEDLADRNKKEAALEGQRKEREKRLEELQSKGLTAPINWRKLIKRMFPDPIEKEEESLARVHRRTRSQLAIAGKRSLVSVKAGTIKTETDAQSLLFILDKSGSMNAVIDSISIELMKLIKKNISLGVKNMFIIMFDSNWDIYKVNFDKKNITYQEVTNPADIITKDHDTIKLKGQPKPIKQLFQIQWGMGTEFPDEIFRVISKMSKQKFNQVMFTDTDILSDSNIKVLKKAVLLGNKKPYSFNIIMDSQDSYEAGMRALGGKYKYMSHL